MNLVTMQDDDAESGDAIAKHSVYRGSRKHVIDWTGKASFLNDLRQTIGPLSLSIGGGFTCMPRGADSPKEARLEEFGPHWIPDLAAWTEIQSWWLRYRRRANTPNWDIAVGCQIDQRPGLILVEAKANWPELGIDGKKLPRNASQRSRENHEHIGRAIDQACSAWQSIDKRVKFTRDSHYQLANRLAFTWKLATLGFPIVLLYLGFTGDEGLRAEVGPPFSSDEDWRKAFAEYIQNIFPADLLDKRVEFTQVPVWVIARSRSVIEISASRLQNRGL
jgi:hypothetical protein